MNKKEIRAAIVLKINVIKQLEQELMGQRLELQELTTKLFSSKK